MHKLATAAEQTRCVCVLLFLVAAEIISLHLRRFAFSATQAAGGRGSKSQGSDIWTARWRCTHQTAHAATEGRPGGRGQRIVPCFAQLVDVRFFVSFFLVFLSSSQLGGCTQNQRLCACWSHIDISATNVALPVAARQASAF